MAVAVLVGEAVYEGVLVKVGVAVTTGVLVGVPAGEHENTKFVMDAVPGFP